MMWPFIVVAGAPGISVVDPGTTMPPPPVAMTEIRTIELPMVTEDRIGGAVFGGSVRVEPSTMTMAPGWLDG